jgi:hypothetical protein
MRRSLMGIVGGLDVHRRQITFDYLDEASGVVRRGRIEASREILRRGWPPRSPNARPDSRWRPAPAGDSWSRS